MGRSSWDISLGTLVLGHWSRDVRLGTLVLGRWSWVIGLGTLVLGRWSWDVGLRIPTRSTGTTLNSLGTVDGKSWNSIRKGVLQK